MLHRDKKIFKVILRILTLLYVDNINKILTSYDKFE